MTDGVTLNGNWTLPGVAVDVCIAGLDCGAIVSNLDGSVFVPFGADPDGLFTASYLNSVSDSTSTNPALSTFNITNGAGDILTVSVPVLVGYSYSSVGWCLRPTTEGQTKSPLGGAVGKKRRMQRAGFEFINAQGVAIGNKQGNYESVATTTAYSTTTTQTFNYTNNTTSTFTTLTVPGGALGVVHTITISAQGSIGQSVTNGNGGKGGAATGTLAVASAQTFTYCVGGYTSSGGCGNGGAQAISSGAWCAWTAMAMVMAPVRSTRTS